LLSGSQRSLAGGAFKLRGNPRLLPRTLRDFSRLCTWPRAGILASIEAHPRSRR
jgi:hypothetical protein